VDLNRLLVYLDWEAAARDVLSKEVFDYIQEGAGNEDTVLNNWKAFRTYGLIPRVLRGVTTVDTRARILGIEAPAPIFMAPVAAQGLFNHQAELCSSSAASKMGTPFILSTMSTVSMEQVAEKMGASARLFQLYLWQDSEVNADLVSRAEKSGYNAIVLTVDGPVIGWRPRSLRNSFDFTANITGNIYKYMMDTQTTRKLQLKPNISWDDIDTIKDCTNLPIIIKGIMHPSDAAEALRHDVDAIIVSNHGGRQLDGCVSSLDALYRVSSTVKGEIPLLVDGGIRSGTDVLKALCLGASGVLVGRLYIYGLAAGGATGVEKVVANLKRELETSMYNCGISDLSQADESFIRKI
jgi:isopentenyl diphosphate isomerase/L-lactate dehydrogenase-like FMN-dependent dehydrogenase